MGGTDAHATVQPICLLELKWYAAPVLEDMLSEVLEVHLSLPRWLDEALPVGLVEDGDDTAPATYLPVTGDFLDLQALDGHGNVVLGDVVNGGLVG